MFYKKTMHFILMTVTTIIAGGNQAVPEENASWLNDDLKLDS